MPSPNFSQIVMAPSLAAPSINRRLTVDSPYRHNLGWQIAPFGTPSKFLSRPSIEPQTGWCWLIATLRRACRNCLTGITIGRA